MKKVAILTDSNGGMTAQEARDLGVTVLPMPVYIDKKLYFEGVDLSQERFFELLPGASEVRTSQPSPAAVTDMWDELLKTHDEVVHIPMSSGLSGSCDSAKMLAREYGGRVEVVDNHRISVTMRRSVFDAVKLKGEGKTAAEIKKRLEETAAVSSIYITLETLYYLKKGGRITPLAAAVGTLLNIKPVLQIQGDKLDAYSKVRGKAAARAVMIKAIKKDFESRFRGEVERGEMRLDVAYSGNLAEAEEWKKEVEAAFPGFTVGIAPLPLSVACHIGAGSLALACAVVL